MCLSICCLTRRAAASIKKAVDAVNGGGKVEVQHLDLASLKWVVLFCLAPSSALTWPATQQSAKSLTSAERLPFMVARRHISKSHAHALSSSTVS